MSVDTRIVIMEFNNKDFEAGVSQTQQSLSSLNDSLNNLGKDAKNNKDLQQAFGQISENANVQVEKINRLESVINGFLGRVGEKLADFSIDLTKSLSVDQVAEGFGKYEKLVTGTAGLYNIGKYYNKSYEDVLGYLDQLQWYADATSFSMDAMMSAFLSAVNAGTDMDDAVAVIMGLGNSFTYAGQTATQMDGAFAMFSKTMADEANLGKAVYNSLMRVYHVITPELQNKFVDTAKAMGKLTKEQEALARADFANSLSNKWLTGDIIKEVFSKQYGEYATDVYKFAKGWKDGTIEVTEATRQWAKDNDIQEKMLLTTSQAMDLYERELANTGKQINQFARDTFAAAMEAKTFSEVIDAVKDAVSSQWSQIFQAIFGDYEKAKVLFTNMGDYISSIFVTPIANLADTVKLWMAFDTGLKDSDQNIIYTRDLFLKSFKNIADGIQSFLQPIGEAWREVFPAPTIEMLAEIVKKFQEFTSKLILSEEAKSVIKEIFKILFSGLKIIGAALGAVVYVLKSLFNVIKPIFPMIKTGINYIAKAANSVAKIIEDLDLFTRLANILTFMWSGVTRTMKSVFSNFTLGQKFVNGFNESFKDLNWSVEGIETTLVNFKNFINEQFKQIDFSSFTNAIVTELNYIETVLTPKLEEFKAWFQEMRTKYSIENIITSIELGVLGLVDVFGKAFTKIQEFFQGIGKATEETIETSASIIDTYRAKIEKQNALDNVTRTIKEILGLLRGILGLDIMNSFAKIFRNIKRVEPFEIFGSLAKSLNAFKRNIDAKSIKTIAGSILMLAGAMLVLSLIPKDKIVGTTVAFGIIVGAIAGLIALLNKMETATISIKNGKLVGSGKIGGVGATLLGIGAGLLLIAMAMKW